MCDISAIRLQVTRSNWDAFTLSCRQLRYATMDAVVTLALFRKLRFLHAVPNTCNGCNSMLGVRPPCRELYVKLYFGATDAHNFCCCIIIRIASPQWPCVRSVWQTYSSARCAEWEQTQTNEKAHAERGASGLGVL